MLFLNLPEHHLFLLSSYQFVAAKSSCEKSLQNKLEHMLPQAWEKVSIAEERNKASSIYICTFKI